MKRLLSEGRLNDTLLLYNVGTLALEYKLINYCPSHISYYLAHNCITPKSLDDFTPVSSRDGEKLFLNKHCARCHGYNDVVSWNLYLSSDCMSITSQSFLSIQERDSFILKSCILDASPPSSINIQQVACSDSKITSKCISHDLDTNQYRQWQQKCLDVDKWQNTQYTFISDSREHRYKNVFCFLCNQDTSKINYDPIDMCQRIESENGRSNNGAAFSYLLLADHTKDTLSQEKCAIYEIYDRYQVCSLHFSLIFGTRT